MSSDIASVRAEIKAWERKFKETNGREPTIDDIKKQSVVAQKYKLYKKLSKAAAATSSSTTRRNDPPSTPQRQSPSGSKPPSNLLQSASRVVETTAPLTGYNPFSPQKKSKGKRKESIQSGLLLPTATDPFASPQKSRVQRPQRQSSTESFSPYESAQPSTSARLPLEPVSAVSRARKRLRGEPVSPSPNKEKRRRVLSPASLPFPSLQLDVPGSGSDASGDEEGDDRDSNCDSLSFVDDSPMKPTKTGKAFAYLFEEVVKPTQTMDLNDIPTANSQSTSKRERSKVLSTDVDVFSDASKTTVVHKPSTKESSSVKKLQSLASAKSRQNLIRKALSTDSRSTKGGRKQSPQEILVSAEHVPPEFEQGQNDMTMDDPDEKPLSEPTISAPRLLPPSPNPNIYPSGRSKPNDARSAKFSKVTSRKKAKHQDGDHAMEGMEDDDGSSSDGSSTHHSVKLVHHSRGICATLPTEEVNTKIEDPVLNYARRDRPRVQGSVSLMKQGGDSDVNATPGAEHERGDEATASEDKEAEDVLPNKLRRVLLLQSLRSRQGEYEEERIVRGLLSGRRVVHYDSRKGGEIWGVGEDDKDEFADEEPRIDEGLDEWEGDPVPWEVGELSETHYHLEEL